MNDKGVVVVDGSHLIQSIYDIQMHNETFKNRKVDIGILTSKLGQKWNQNINTFLRTVYYFKPDDNRIPKYLKIPDPRVPGAKDHWIIKYCGQSIKSVPIEQLEKIDKKYRDHFSRGEKGLDVQLACDVLQFAFNKVASNFVFLVDDRDYLPLFKAVQDIGANAYLTGLSSDVDVSLKIAEACDRYQTLDGDLTDVFVE